MPIEKHAPGLDRIVDENQQIEALASGFGGDTGPRIVKIFEPTVSLEVMTLPSFPFRLPSDP